MPQLLGLIFDLDGTLVDSVADLRQALNALLAVQGRRAVSLAEVQNMIGDGLQTLIARAFAATGAPATEREAKTILDDFLRIYQTQTASVDQLYPKVVETLDFFRKKNIKIGLCTNKLYAPTLRILVDTGIAAFFDFVAGADTFPVYKPHPGHVSGVAKGMQVPVENCVMIGDSPNDILSARGAGVASIAVSHGYGRDVESLGADAIIAGFEELPKTLRRLGFDFVG